jgi:hypothetical protein
VEGERAVVGAKEHREGAPSLSMEFFHGILPLEPCLRVLLFHSVFDSDRVVSLAAGAGSRRKGFGETS